MAKFNADAYKKALESKIIKAIPKILEEDVKPNASTMIRNEIKKSVYNTYTPVEYIRREARGGLLDPDNTVVQVDGLRISAKNITKPNDSLFGTPFHSNPMLIDLMDEGSIPILPGVKSAPWIDQRVGIKRKITNEFFKGLNMKKIIRGSLERELMK